MIIERLDTASKFTIPVSTLKIGELFLYNNTLFMRAKPVSWILNSSLVQDKLANGFIFAVDMEAGKIVCIKGTEKVEPVFGELKWSIR